MFNKRCIFGECGRNPPKYIVKVTAEPSDFQTVAGGFVRLRKQIVTFRSTLENKKILSKKEN